LGKERNSIAGNLEAGRFNYVNKKTSTQDTNRLRNQKRLAAHIADCSTPRPGEGQTNFAKLVAEIQRDLLFAALIATAWAQEELHHSNALDRIRDETHADIKEFASHEARERSRTGYWGLMGLNILRDAAAPALDALLAEIVMPYNRKNAMTLTKPVRLAQSARHRLRKAGPQAEREALEQLVQPAFILEFDGKLQDFGR
jgi:hypothetical protein